MRGWRYEYQFREDNKQALKPVSVQRPSTTFPTVGFSVEPGASQILSVTYAAVEKGRDNRVDCDDPDID